MSKLILQEIGNVLITQDFGERADQVGDSSEEMVFDLSRPRGTAHLVWA